MSRGFENFYDGAFGAGPSAGGAVFGGVCNGGGAGEAEHVTTLGQYAAVSFFIIVKFEANLAGGKVFE